MVHGAIVVGPRLGSGHIRTIFGTAIMRIHGPQRIGGRQGMVLMVGVRAGCGHRPRLLHHPTRQQGGDHQDGEQAKSRLSAEIPQSPAEVSARHADANHVNPRPDYNSGCPPLCGVM